MSEVKTLCLTHSWCTESPVGQGLLTLLGVSFTFLRFRNSHSVIVYKSLTNNLSFPGAGKEGRTEKEGEEVLGR